MADLNNLRRLLEAQAAGYSLVVALLIRQLINLWQGFDKWYDGDLVRSHAARSATIVESAQSTIQFQTLTYMKFVYQQYDDLQFPSEADIDAIDADVLARVVSPLEEWDRPAEQFRYAKSIGKTDEEALQIALDRVQQLGDLDAELAMRQQANKIFRATPQVTGFRRVLHPELAQSGQSCGLCIAASTRVYSKKELLPIHDHCHCGVLPIVAGEDPAHTFNLDDLQQLYKLAGGTSAQALSRVRYKLNDHGELGPYLVEDGAPNRSAGRSLGAPKSFNRLDSVAAQIASLNDSLPRLIARRQAGEDVSQAINWQQDRLRILEAEQSAADSAIATRRKKKRKVA